MTTEEKWYENGLRFKCTGCGKCCTGAPGVVWVSEKEIEEMAAFLGLSIPEFSCTYLRKIDGRFSLTESKVTYDCVFLKEKKCTIYGARPTQCRTYPWWPQNLSSSGAWEEQKKICEGMHQEGPLISKEEIEKEELIQIAYNSSQK